MDWWFSWRLIRYHGVGRRDIIGNGNAKVAGFALVFGGGGSHDVRKLFLLFSIVLHYLDEGMRGVHLAI
jgi:hypothetical protein